MSLLERIKSTRIAGAPDRLKILVHGPPGAGKTHLLGTTGEDSRVLILSAESGLLTLRGHDIDCIQVSSVDAVREVFAFLQAGDHGYAWVCLDSVSEIAELCLAEEMTKTKDGRRAYGELATVMRQLLRAFKYLPYHVVMTCKQERIDDEGRLVRAPMLPGKQLSQGIAYMFDLVFALRVERDEEGATTRALQTQPVNGYAAKDRSGALELFEEPNLAHIVGKILKGEING